MSQKSKFRQTKNGECGLEEVLREALQYAIDSDKDFNE